MGFPLQPLCHPRTPAYCLILAAAKTVPGARIRAGGVDNLRHLPGRRNRKKSLGSMNLYPIFADEETRRDK